MLMPNVKYGNLPGMPLKQADVTSPPPCTCLQASVSPYMAPPPSLPPPPDAPACRPAT